jgi:hypothetical protein
MKAILDLQVRREEIRRACIAWAGNFSWEKTYARMMHGIRGLFAAEQRVS